MAQTIVYKPITGWMLGDKIEKDNDGKTVVKLVIGEIEENKETIEYIVEDIYKNILDKVIQNPNNYRIEPKVNQVPQLLILYDGYLMIHNREVKHLCENVLYLLEQIPDKDILDAYLEMRLNMDAKGKLKESTEYILATIRKKTGENISSVFVREMIYKYIEEKLFSVGEDEDKIYVRTMSYKDLLYYTTQILQYELTQEINDDYLSSLSSVENFKKVLEDEVFFRLIKGKLTE